MYPCIVLYPLPGRHDLFVYYSLPAKKNIKHMHCCESQRRNSTAIKFIGGLATNVQRFRKY